MTFICRRRPANSCIRRTSAELRVWFDVASNFDKPFVRCQLGMKFWSYSTKGVPDYREYNKNALYNNHNYTAKANEHNSLLNVDWNDEEIGWYGLK